MEKLLFFSAPIDIAYLPYALIWRKRTNNKTIESLTNKSFLTKDEYLSARERAMLNIFCLNLLSKFYISNYPARMTNSFISAILQIIDNLRIQISCYQYEVINYWRTIVLARSRNKKTILKPFVDAISNNKAFFKMHNIAVYCDLKTKKVEKSISIRLANKTQTLLSELKKLKQVWEQYKLVGKGSLYFQQKSLTIVYNITSRSLPSEDPGSKAFRWANISEIIIDDKIAYLHMNNQKLYILVLPYNDSELLLTYLWLIRTFLKKNNVTIVTKRFPK